MLRVIRKVLPWRAVALAALVPAHAAFASGYAINDQGSRAMAQGLATAATLEGPETIYYNPAGIAGLEGWSLGVGATLLRADFSSMPAETPSSTFDSSRDQFVVPHLYLAKGLPGRWSLGLSVNAPFGLATDWPADFPGRFISRIADLETVQTAIVAAAELPRGWSVGFGPTWTRGEVRLVRDVDLDVFRRGHQGEADLHGEGDTLGLRVGARWRGEKGWSFGLAAHGESRLRLRGDIDYTIPPVGGFSLDEALRQIFQDGTAATTLTLPASVTAGFGHVGARWTWEVDATWTHWSVMQEVVVDLQEVIIEGQPFVLQEFVTNLWHDAWAARVGVRRRCGEHWTWAAGVYHDQTPVPVRTADPLLPDSDRLSATGGGTWTSGRLTLDFAAQGVLFDDLDTRGTGNPFESRYDASVFALGVTAGWSWGR